MSDTPILCETVIEGGKHWPYTAHRGSLRRLIDMQGGANVGMPFYNPQNPLERGPRKSDASDRANKIGSPGSDAFYLAPAASGRSWRNRPTGTAV
jgi:hypothetical protein